MELLATSCATITAAMRTPKVIKVSARANAEPMADFLDIAALAVGKHLHREPQRSLRVSELNNVLTNETDRGFVLVLASYLELLLSELLAASVAGSPEDHDDYLERNLSTLAARERAAAALGLISPAMKDDIGRIRVIRNEFAHKWDRTSLDAAITASPALTAKLKAIHHDFMDMAFPARKRLHRAGLIIAGLIDASIATRTRPVPPANFDEDVFARTFVDSLDPKLRAQLEALMKTVDSNE